VPEGGGVKIERVDPSPDGDKDSNCPVCSAACPDFYVEGLTNSYISACEAHKHGVATDALAEQARGVR
jgi:formylmethanofuran dehydrogenase subunit B